MSLTQPIQALLQRLDERRTESSRIPDGATTLEVDALVSGAAKFYEKVRYLIDYREEHTIRRSAIERIIKRRVLIESQPVFGQELLRELAEGQYVPKDIVTEEVGEKISSIVTRYLRLSEQGKGSTRLDRRLLSFAASEIEQLFSEEATFIDEVVAEAMYSTLRSQTSVYGATERAVDTQLFCAVRRGLLGVDNEMLSFALWKAYVPQWNAAELDAGTLRKDVSTIIEAIEWDVKNPLQWQLTSKIKNESIYFQVLRELLHKKKGGAEWILQNQDDFDAFTREFLKEKYEEENKKLQSSGVRAVGYLFVTKITAAFIFELPYELLVLGKFHALPLLTNTLFHPFLLLSATRGMRSLNAANTDAVVSGIHDTFYKNKIRAIRIQPEHTALTAIFGFVYLILICALFLGIVGILNALDFNFVSMILFVFFLALVSYFAFRIRSTAQRWKVSGKQGPLSILVHVLAVPIVRTGRWLSQTFSSINVFILFMDFIIETPFKLLLSFSSKFFVYLREKADDVY